MCGEVRGRVCIRLKYYTAHSTDTVLDWAPWISWGLEEPKERPITTPFSPPPPPG